MTQTQEIIHKFHTAMGSKNYKTARQCLHDNLSFKGPIDTFHNADAYVEAIKKLAPITERIDVKKMFVDGNDVCILYDLVTNTPAGTAFVAEWFQVKGEKIAAIRAVFDARPFAAMWEKSAAGEK